MSPIAAVYARKSTDQNGVADEQKSVARQVEHARAYAQRKGWTVLDDWIFVDDGISGAEFAGRPGFLRLMNALKPQPPFEVLVMSEESRLGREQIEVSYALKQLVSAGVRVFCYLTDTERTLNSPIEKAMLALQTMADEMERDKARQRTSDALMRKAKAGHVVGGRCFGYDHVEVRDASGVRSHVERRINESEAAVVRQIFELASAGYGKKRIARILNEAGAPCPRARQGRPSAWSPSSVFEVLHRALYRGEIIWRATRKHDRWGRKQWAPRPESEWVRVEAPHLRLVEQNLWNAAHSRLSEVRTAYLRGTHGLIFGRPPGPVEPKYLLSGFASCANCGGSLYVRSRSNGLTRKYFYGCSSYHLRGRTVCTNCSEMPMDLANRAVLGKLRDDLLQPAMLEAAVARAAEYLRPAIQGDERDRLHADLETVDRQLANLADAIAAGGDGLMALIDAIRERERHRAALIDQLRRAEALARTVNLDARRLERELVAELEDWRGLLADDAEAARPVLRRVLLERLAFTPLEPGIHAPVAFKGMASIGGLLTGTVGVQNKWRARQDSNLWPPA